MNFEQFIKKEQVEKRGKEIHGALRKEITSRLDNVHKRRMAPSYGFTRTEDPEYLRNSYETLLSLHRQIESLDNFLKLDIKSIIEELQKADKYLNSDVLDDLRDHVSFDIAQKVIDQ